MATFGILYTTLVTHSQKGSHRAAKGEKLTSEIYRIAQPQDVAVAHVTSRGHRTKLMGNKYING